MTSFVCMSCAPTSPTSRMLTCMPERVRKEFMFLKRMYRARKKEEQKRLKTQPAISAADGRTIAKQVREEKFQTNNEFRAAQVVEEWKLQHHWDKVIAPLWDKPCKTEHEQAICDEYAYIYDCVMRYYAYFDQDSCPASHDDDMPHCEGRGADELLCRFKESGSRPEHGLFGCRFCMTNQSMRYAHFN